MNRRVIWWVFATAACLMAGCNQGPSLVGQPAPVYPGRPQQQPAHATQMQTLSQRATTLDSDNKSLYTELARSEQQVKLLEDEVKLLRQQLQTRANELEGLEVAKNEMQTEIDTIRSATRKRGGAVITANSSLRENTPVVRLTGLEVTRRGNSVSIQVPADRIFQYGTSTMLSTAQPILDQIAAAIRQHYPEQSIIIEGHTDSVPQGATSNHRLSSEQAAVVFDAFTRRNQLPAEQLSTSGFGPNRPLVSNATPAGRAKNRRIEVVVVSETFRGN